MCRQVLTIITSPPPPSIKIVLMTGGKGGGGGRYQKDQVPFSPGFLPDGLHTLNNMTQMVKPKINNIIWKIWKIIVNFYFRRPMHIFIKYTQKLCYSKQCTIRTTHIWTIQYTVRIRRIYPPVKKKLQHGGKMVSLCRVHIFNCSCKKS